jgi:hypothetical protein
VVNDYRAFFMARAASTGSESRETADAAAASDSKAGDAVVGKSAPRFVESKMVRRRINRVHPKPL